MLIIIIIIKILVIINLLNHKSMTRTLNKSHTESPINRQTIISIVRTSSMLMKLAHRFFAQHEINDSQFNILLALKSNQAGLSQTELGKMLIVAKPNLVGMIDNLQKLGYVDRATNLQDRRLNTIQITLTGTQFVTRLEPLYEENIAQLLKDIDDGQKQDLIEFMEQLRKNVIDIDL